jgi:DNA-binding transcriptional regulator YdaS (Cro superfamily)
MTKFAEWLNDNPGMQRKLCELLKTRESTVSSVKVRRRPMPTWWMPAIVKASKGRLTYETLIQENRRRPE